MIGKCRYCGTATTHHPLQSVACADCGLEESASESTQRDGDVGDAEVVAHRDTTDLRTLQWRSWKIAEAKGFHEGGRSRPEALALIHSEVSEALEADRAGDDENYAEELADVIIRIMDHAQAENIDLATEILDKQEQNRDRERKHGKAY